MSKYNRAGRDTGKKAIELLSSMKTALFLLVALAALSAAGSLIPQGEAGEFYSAHYGEMAGRLIVFLSLGRMYTAWWFIALGLMFFAGILVCSVRRMGKARGVRGVGLIPLHLGVLLVFAGSVVSGLTGQSTYVEIGAGDTVEIFLGGVSEGVLAVDDFGVEYYDSREPSQYVSQVTLKTAGGREIGQKIMVNHPLKAGSLKIYQKSYGWMPEGQVALGDRVIPFSLPGGDEINIDPAGELRLKVIFIPDFNEAAGTLQSKSPQPKKAGLRPGPGKGNAGPPGNPGGRNKKGGGIPG